MLIALRRGSAAMHRCFHLSPLLATPVKAGQIHPLRSGVGFCRNRLLELALRRPVVLALLGDAAAKLVSAGWINLVQLRRDVLRFLDSSAYNSRGLPVEFTQICQSIGVSRIKLNGLFELSSHTLGQRIRAHERSPVGLLTQGAGQPQVKHGILPVQPHRFFAFSYSHTPLFERKANAACHVVSHGQIRRGRGKGIEQAKRFVRLASLQVRAGLGQDLRKRRQLLTGRGGHGRLSGRAGDRGRR